MQTPTVEKIDIDQIVPYEYNPRKNDKAVEKVKASIEAYGYNQLIAVDSKNVIISGHTRYRAMREMGVTGEIGVLKLPLNTKQANEFRVVDNRTAEVADWDYDLLKVELRKIDVDLSFHFPEMENLLATDLTEYKPITQEQIQKAAAQAETRYDAPTPANKHDKMIEEMTAKGEIGDTMTVTCPHCLEEIELLKEQVRIKLGL